MQYIIYFLIAIGSTTIGSLTGMGGGIIIKPLLDVLGDYSVSAISVLSTITVFSMSLVSVGKQVLGGRRIPVRLALPMGVGSVVGGTVGQWLLSFLVGVLSRQETVTIAQNVILAVLVAGVFLYMQKKDSLPTLRLSGVIPGGVTGLALGAVSSFLGIGGGPFNVAVMIFLFSMETKAATVCSVLTILFSQAAKLVTIGMGGGFGSYDLTMLWVMVPGAVAGGFLGAALNKKLPEKKVETAFQGVQVFVFLVAVYNIVQAII